MMINNFFKKLLEFWIQGLLINGQHQAIAQQSLWSGLNKTLNQKD